MHEHLTPEQAAKDAVKTVWGSGSLHPLMEAVEILLKAARDKANADDPAWAALLEDSVPARLRASRR